MSKQEVLEPLSGDEKTILEIASHGEFMIETGRWHDPIMSLVKRGYLEGPQFNRYITPAGHAAFKSFEHDDDERIESNYRLAENILREKLIAQQEIRALILPMVDQWVGIAKRSAGVTGNGPAQELSNWLRVLKDAVTDKLRE